MAVETWNPGAPPAGLSPQNLERLLEAAQHLDEPRLGLDPDTAGELAPLVRHSAPAPGTAGTGPGIDWARQGEALDDEQLLALIRVFVLGESGISGWESGDASPVIPLAALLKRRGGYPADLTAWIRANSDNRFLPYGNLMSRL